MLCAWISCSQTAIQETLPGYAHVKKASPYPRESSCGAGTLVVLPARQLGGSQYRNSNFIYSSLSVFLCLSIYLFHSLPALNHPPLHPYFPESSYFSLVRRRINYSRVSLSSCCSQSIHPVRLLFIM